MVYDPKCPAAFFLVLGDGRSVVSQPKCHLRRISKDGSVDLGSIISAVGITVLAWATHEGTTSTILGMMALTGHGVGMRISPSALHGLAFFPDMIAQITCLVSLAIPLGGTVALTLMSTVFNNKSGLDNQNAREGIMYAFVSLIPFMWLCVVGTMFLGNAWILEDGRHETAYGSYFWSWVVGRELPRERRARGDNRNTGEDLEPGIIRRG